MLDHSRKNIKNIKNECCDRVEWRGFMMEYGSCSLERVLRCDAEMWFCCLLMSSPTRVDLSVLSFSVCKNTCLARGLVGFLVFEGGQQVLFDFFCRTCKVLKNHSVPMKLWNGWVSTCARWNAHLPSWIDLPGRTSFSLNCLFKSVT